MFYEDLKREEQEEMRLEYERIKPYIGTLVIESNRIVRFAGLVRDDKFDGEWCHRYLVFPSPFDFEKYGQMYDSSVTILFQSFIPLKDRLTPEEYYDMDLSWQLNETRCPYARNYLKDY